MMIEVIPPLDKSHLFSRHLGITLPNQIPGYLAHQGFEKSSAMKLIIAVFIILHGLIHIIGFARAFHLGSIAPTGSEVNKFNGIMWLLAMVMFIIAAVLFQLNVEGWWILAALPIIISQLLIFTNWNDVWFGTIANVLVLGAVIVGYGTWNFHYKYKHEVRTALQKAVTEDDSLLAESDLQALPYAVKKYIGYTGAIGKPKVRNFRIDFDGKIRKDAQSAWMPFTSEQYNFIDSSRRLFFMNATMKHLPVAGFHSFTNGTAFMDIRLLSLFKVQYQAGAEMDTAETVTYFNDMCCMAPATLIDKRIQWLEGDSMKVKASFTNNHITISAWLYFNEMGQLVNFVSDDRYAAGDNHIMRKIQWSTPLKDYKKVNGYRLASYAETIYHYPQGDLCYGTFSLTGIKYNCK